MVNNFNNFGKFGNGVYYIMRTCIYIRFLTAAMRLFNSSAGSFPVSSWVSPISLLPRITPTVHTPAFTPSLISAIVSPYFITL